MADKQGSVYKQTIIEQNTRQPNRVIVGLLKIAAVAGDFLLDPFKFSKFNFSYIELQLNRMREGIVYSLTDQPAKTYLSLQVCLIEMRVDTRSKLLLISGKCEHLLCL